MTGIVTIICLVLALGVVVITAIRSLRNQSLAIDDLVAAALLELGVLVYLGVRVADLAGGHRTHNLAVTLAYLIGIALVMPVAAALALAEDSRWGPVVLTAGAVVVCVLFARIDQVWPAHG